MKTIWHLLAAVLIPGCVNAQVSLIPPPFRIDGTNVISGEYMNSAFGPRDIGNTPGSRFHEGIDTAPGGMGQVISAMTAGKINQIIRRSHGTGNALYIQNGTDEFGYWHLFTNAPSTQDVAMSGLILGQYNHFTGVAGLRFTSIVCDVMWDTRSNPRQVLMDQNCPPRAGQLVKGPSLADYRVVKSVSAGTRMGAKGNSGAVGLAPHLHLAFRTSKGLKNPLSRIQHDTPNYTATFVAGPSSTAPISTPTFATTDLARGAWVRVDFSTGYDLDEVEFTVEGNGSSTAAGRYRLGGRPSDDALPANIKDMVYRGSEVPPSSRLGVYATPAGIGKKELMFWVNLPTGLARGSYRLNVRILSVLGAPKEMPLSFEVASEVIFSDNFDSGNLSGWVKSTNYAAVSNVTTRSDVYVSAGNSLFVYLDAPPGSLNRLFVTATRHFNVPHAGDYALELYAKSETCDVCTISYEVFIDGARVVSGSSVAFQRVSVRLPNMTVGTHSIGLGMSTNFAYSGRFNASFDDVVIRKLLPLN